jgi:hypothetical protein
MGLLHQAGTNRVAPALAIRWDRTQVGRRKQASLSDIAGLEPERLKPSLVVMVTAR